MLLPDFPELASRDPSTINFLVLIAPKTGATSWPVWTIVNDAVWEDIMVHSQPDAILVHMLPSPKAVIRGQSIAPREEPGIWLMADAAFVWTHKLANVISVAIVVVTFVLAGSLLYFGGAFEPDQGEGTATVSG